MVKMRSLYSFALFALFAVLATTVCTTSQAQVFTDRVAFAAAVSGMSPVTETYDGVAAPFAFPSGSAFDGVTYATGDGEDLVVTAAFLPLSPPNGLGSEAGFEFFTADDVLTITFASPMSCVGLNFNTFATALGSYHLALDNGEGADSDFDPFPGFGTGQFAGIISATPFTSVVVTAPGGFAYTADDLTYCAGPTVPEPGVLGLLAGGLVSGLALLRRRR